MTLQEAGKALEAVSQWVYNTAKNNQKLYLSRKIDVSQMRELHEQTRAEAMRRNLDITRNMTW